MRLPGGPLASLMRSRYCGAATRGMGPNSVTFVPPCDAPPGAPSVKSHTLPADWATSDQRPAAASASARLAKFSIRQWMTVDRAPGSILFVTSDYDDLEMNKPLLTLWMNLAITSLMTLPRTREGT